MTGQGHPAVPHPNQNYPGMTHDAIKQLVTQDVNPGAAYKAGDEWKDMAGQLKDAAITLDAAINGSQSHWDGAAADLARAHLAKVRDWSADTAGFFNATGTAMHDQVDAAAKAKADMPDPVEYNPTKMFEQAASNPISMLMLPVTMYETHQASTDAKNKAVQVIQARDTSMQAASSSIPAFTPPPDLSSGGTTTTQSASVGPSGAGGGVAAYHGTSGGGSYGGGGGYTGGGGGTYHGTTPPPGGGTYNPGPVGGPTRISGYDPGPVGPGGPGYNGPGYNNGPGVGGPNGPYGPGEGPGLGVAGGFGPGGGGGGGGAGYRGGAGGMGSSSTSSAAKPGAGSSAGAGGMGEEGAGARGGMGAAGGAGQSGMGPGAGGRGGKKEEDKEHKRPTFLVETDDVFGDGQMVAPTVIGENPTGGY